MIAFQSIEHDGTVWIYDLYWAREDGKDTPLLIVKQWIQGHEADGFCWSVYACPWFGLLRSALWFPRAEAWRPTGEKVTSGDVGAFLSGVLAQYDTADRMLGIGSPRLLYSRPRRENGAYLGSK